MKYLVAVLLLLAAMPAATADDKQLLGTWNAVGHPGKTAEFREGGLFRYIYNPTPPIIVLQLRWNTNWLGKLVLSMENGGNARSCSYKIEGDNLTIHDGSGASCVPHQPVEMVTRFTRSK